MSEESIEKEEKFKESAQLRSLAKEILSADTPELQDARIQGKRTISGTWGKKQFEEDWLAFWAVKQKKIDDIMEILWGYEA